jgi:hypothetical protein
MSDHLTLAEAVFRFAQLTHTFSDADLEQPWMWRAHEEGVRFAFIGTLHELKTLALDLADRRAKSDRPLTRAQRVLGQYLEAYRDLQAVMIGASEEEYGREPASGEWPLRYVLGHTAGAQRNFFALVHYGLARQRDGGERPTRLPEGEANRLVGPYEEFRAIMEEKGLAEMVAFYEKLHQRTMAEFAGASDNEMQGLSLWWENEEYNLEYRIHRFDAHLRQHTIQAEKTLEMLGRGPNEAKRLLRLIYRALTEVESAVLGEEEVGAEAQVALAAAIVARAEEAVGVVEQARAMLSAVKSGNLAQAQELLAANPKLAAARDRSGLSAILTAAYYGQQELLAALMAAGTKLNIFEAAAAGRFDLVQQAFQEWPGWINEYAQDGFTPLQLACFFGHEEMALWLIEQGADVNAAAKNKQGVTPIHATAANGNLTVLEALLKKGAAVNARQEGAFTALHEAANSGNTAMARLLLAHAADASLTTAEGKTALEIAQAKGHQEVANLLA